MNTSTINQDSGNRWLLAARPKTLWAAIAPVIVGTAMAYEAEGAHWPAALAALIGAILIQIGTNYANDFFDFKKGADSGQRLGPTRVTQAGLVTLGEMKRATILVFGLALLTGVYLVVRGGWPIAVIGLTSILWGVLYTAGPKPIAYIGLGELFVLIYFGPVAVGGTFYVQTLDINVAVLLIGLSCGLFSVAILTINNLRDIESDRRTGKRTLAVRLGPRFARWEYLLCIVLACMIPVGIYIWTNEHTYILFSTAIALPAVPAFRKVLSTAIGPELNTVLASTGKLLLAFSIVFSIGWLL